MNKKIKIFAILASVVIVAMSAKEYKNPLRELIDNKKNFRKKIARVKKPNTFIYKQQLRKGFAKKSDFIKPKKVGMICFFVKDQAKTTYSASWKTTTMGTSDAIKSIAQDLYNQSLPELKASFKNLGYELQEPKEYCDTKEKMDNFQNYKIHFAPGEKLIHNLFIGGKGSGYWAVPAGYRPFPMGGMTSAGYMKRKIKNRPYHYMESLDMDALLFVYLSISSAEGKLKFAKCDLHVRTPNFQEEVKTGIQNFAIFSEVQAKIEKGDIFDRKMITTKRGKEKRGKESTG